MLPLLLLLLLMMRLDELVLCRMDKGKRSQIFNPNRCSGGGDGAASMGPRPGVVMVAFVNEFDALLAGKNKCSFSDARQRPSRNARTAVIEAQTMAF
jgi:hypothetical protein